MNILEQAGLSHYLSQTDSSIDPAVIGRIVTEFGTRYTVLTESGPHEAVAPKTLIAGSNSADRPKTGDWVTLEALQGEQKVKITAVLPRFSELARKRAGKRLEAQILATNVDHVFIAESAAGDFDPNRIERFLVVPESAHLPATLIFTKSDTCTKEQIAELLAAATARFPELDVKTASTVTGDGIAAIQALLSAGRTAAILGPSGVGKSSLINALIGENQIKTQAVRSSDQKGRHTTTTRDLIVLAAGGVIIDTPGMRELQLWADNTTELNAAFDDLENLSLTCKFQNCDHEKSVGCALQHAVATGTLAPERLASFLKLKTELEKHSTTHSYETGLARKKREKKRAQDVRKAVQHKRGKNLQRAQ